MILSSRFAVSLVAITVFVCSAALPAQIAPAKITHVEPVYPEQARQAGVVGTVMVQITVGTDGRVSDARVIRSIPLLDQAAIDAVKQWVYYAGALTAPVTLTVSVPFSGRALAVSPPRPAGPAVPPPVAARPARAPAAAAPPSAAASASPCVARPGRVVIPPPSPGVQLTPEQAAQAEIRQLNASIESGTLSGDECLNALRRRGYLHAFSGAGGLARRDLDAVIAVNPRDRDAHFFKGLSHGVARLSLPSFTRAIELRPDDAESYAGRGWANLVEQNYREAVVDFGQVLRLSPGDAEGLRGRAWGLVHTGDYDRAIADLDALLKMSRGQPEALALRGTAHYLAGRGDQARGDLRSAMRFRPVPNRAKVYGSVRFDNRRRYGMLQQVVEARAKQNPRDITGLLVSGVLVFRAYDDRAAGGLMRIASDGFARALAIEPASIDALMMRAATYSAPLYGYRADAAIADLSEVIRLDPGYAEAYFRRALIHGADQRSLDLAAADAEKALSLVPGDPVLRGLVNKLKDDRIAYEAEKQRVAEARAQRAESLQRTQEQAAALFLAGVAAAIMTSDGKGPTDEDYRTRQQDILDLWGESLRTPCRTSTGRPC